MCSTDLTLEHGRIDTSSIQQKQASAGLQSGDNDTKRQQHSKHDEGGMLQ